MRPGNSKFLFESFTRSVKNTFFSAGVGERTHTFIRGFSWSLGAAFVSRFITGLTTLASARWMGPKEFGEANLSLASSLWIQIPLYLGLPTAIVHFVSKSQGNERKGWISETFWLSAFLLAATAAMGFLFKPFSSAKLGISEPFFLLALIYSLSTWPFNLLKTYLNADEKFKTRAWAEIAYAILYPISVVLFIRLGYQSAAYVLGLSLPYLIVGAAGLIASRLPVGTPTFHAERTKQLVLFGLLAASGSLAAAFFETPARIIINKYLGAFEVGILSAYQGGSTQMAAFFSAAAVGVFFPIASRTPDKRTLFLKLSKLVWSTFPVMAAVFAAGLWLYLFILGSKYPFELSLCLVFAVAATLSLANSMLAWFVVSYGTRGVIVNGAVGIGAGLINLYGCRWAVPQFQILGAGLAYAAANLISIAIFSLPSIQRWLGQKETNDAVAV